MYCTGAIFQVDNKSSDFFQYFIIICLHENNSYEESRELTKIIKYRVMCLILDAFKKIENIVCFHMINLDICTASKK